MTDLERQISEYKKRLEEHRDEWDDYQLDAARSHIEDLENGVPAHGAKSILACPLCEGPWVIGP